MIRKWVQVGVAVAVAGAGLTLAVAHGGGDAGQRIVAGASSGVAASPGIGAPTSPTSAATLTTLATTTTSRSGRVQGPGLGISAATTTSSQTQSPTTARRVAPSTTTTVRRVAPSTTTTTAHASTTTTTTSAFGQLGPETVTVPYTPGQSSWEAVSNGITLRLRTEPAAPKAGAPVTFHIEAETATQPCCGFYLLYGDGGSSSWKVEWPAGTCRAAGGGPASTDYTHVYNKAGRWEFLYQVVGSCGGGGTNAALHGYLDVAPGGPAQSQGPALPTIKVDRSNDPADPSHPYLFLQAEDVDGYIARFVIDWGDGSPPETHPGDHNPCQMTPSGWPARSDSWAQVPYPTNFHFGAQTATVTVVSTGCDGGDEQTATATAR